MRAITNNERRAPFNLNMSYHVMLCISYTSPSRLGNCGWTAEIVYRKRWATSSPHNEKQTAPTTENGVADKFRSIVAGIQKKRDLVGVRLIKSNSIHTMYEGVGWKRMNLMEWGGCIGAWWMNSMKGDGRNSFHRCGEEGQVIFYRFPSKEPWIYTRIIDIPESKRLQYWREYRK